MLIERPNDWLTQGVVTSIVDTRISVSNVAARLNSTVLQSLAQAHLEDTRHIHRADVSIKFFPVVEQLCQVVGGRTRGSLHQYSVVHGQSTALGKYTSHWRLLDMRPR